MERTISFMNGEGSLGHNTRAFIAQNVDADRTKDNITLVHEDLKKVYHKLFDDSLKKYNAKQKRKDRQIKNYYDKISRSKQEKLFYEVIVQIGNRDDTGVGSVAADIAVKALQDYVELFIRRNPQLYVFGAYIHMDEETPHVHIDFVPFSTDNKRGLETKNSLKGALASRGFESEGKGNTEWQQWSEAEKEDIAMIMQKYGIGWKKLDTHNQHLSVLDYKKQKRSREVKELEQELEDISVVIELKEEREARLDAEINKQEVRIKKECEEAEKTLLMVNSLKEKVYEEGIEQQKRNNLLLADYRKLQDIITDKKEQLADLELALDKVNAAFGRADEELARAKEELAEIRKLRNELIVQGDGDCYLKEEVIQLRYENQNLKAENKGLREKLDKAYEFMKQFMIEGRSMLDKFLEWIGEKVRDVRGR
ncbi:MAG: plasmid recombination protein [Eubacteriales bacterium]|nr:plasmid recombination protein [Eubacteriales bacterium]